MLAPSLAILTLVLALAAQAPSPDALFSKFWDAGSPKAAARAGEAIAASGISFDDAYGRLKAGRPYAAHVPTGRLERHDGVDRAYTLLIPDGYDPARRYQVRIQLHGGVMMREEGGNAPDARAVSRLTGAEQIYIFPAAWRESPWWSDTQLDSLLAILDRVKRTYNIDENHIVVSGVSDGATGAYYVAMRETTEFASFLPLNGYLKVLGNPTLHAGDLFPNNLRNKPFFIVNGGRDPLYPVAAIEPYVEHMRHAGMTVDWEPQPDAGHDTSWWPQLVDRFETFVRDHARTPLPDRLTWETASDSRRNRAHWLVIDRLGTLSEPPLAPEMNTIDLPQWPRTTIFRTPARSGRVDLIRKGNGVYAATRGVAEFTLLISPAQFDLSQPITVVVNGEPRFNARVEPSVATLLKWAAVDNDRTMLFAAEVHVKAQ